MVETRITMRPISLRRVIEICGLALNIKKVKEENVMETLQTTRSRARELLFESSRMGILTRTNGVFLANDNTKLVVEAFEKEDWPKFRTYFMKNYAFYRSYVCFLSLFLNEPRGLLIDQATSVSKSRRLPLNRTAIEVLTNWCERLGIVQRHLYAKRFYSLKDNYPSIENFTKVFEESYKTLNVKSGFGLSLLYVEIPKLREDVCEKLRIPRVLFDSLFTRIYRQRVGKIELSGATVVTAAKKSPLTIRTIRSSRKENILAPKLDTTIEREGIEVSGKLYYYVAIHESLS